MTIFDLPQAAVEFDVPASWIRVELDHPETWQYLIEEVTRAVAVFRERGLADDMPADDQIAADVRQFCEALLKTGVAAVASRSLVANADGVATLITGMVTLAVAPVDPRVSDVEELLEAWQVQPDVKARIVALPCGPALRLELEVTGPGLLGSTPLQYRHIRLLVPILDGSRMAVMVYSTPKLHAECFDAVFDEISLTLRQNRVP